MIKIGKLTDYAVVMMVQLARDDCSRSASALAAATGIPEPTVAKVMKQLSHEKLVVSERGSAGGYRLAKPAAEISVGEIITSMDGPIAIVSCVEGSGDECKTGARCPARGNWDRVNTVIRNALEGFRLSDMIATPACGSKVYNFLGGEADARQH